MGSLALGNSSNVNVALGAPGTLRLFNVTGNLTLDGLLNVEDLGGFGAGVYRIFDYGGALTNNSMLIGATPAGVLAGDLSVQTSIANQVNLVNSAVAPIFNFWGGGSGLWNTVTSNWTDADGTVTGAWSNGEFATFQVSPALSPWLPGPASRSMVCTSQSAATRSTRSLARSRCKKVRRSSV